MIVECAVYEDGRRRPGELPLDEACEAGQEPGAFVWIGLFEPEPQEFDAIREEFSLHPLAVEDALTAHERPKLERYGDTLFLVLKTAEYDDDAEAVRIGEVMVFVGEDFLITVRHGGRGLGDVRERLEHDEKRLRRGTLAALHAIVDRVVDDYEPVVVGVQTDVDEVEQRLFGGEANGDATGRIYRLGREVLEFSRAVTPLLDPAKKLADGTVTGVDGELQTHFRDVYDHVVRVHQQVEGFRELLSSLLQANLTQVTVRQNSDMRKISAWVAILAVPTMVAGIYGMNFEHMPELKWELGYPGVLVVIALACMVLYRQFKRAGWL